MRYSIVCFAAVLIATGAASAELNEEVDPFPLAGLDIFTSVFNAEIEILRGPLQGTIIQLTDVTDSVQTVARSDPFYDCGPGCDDCSTFPVMPPGSTMPTEVCDSDFPIMPEGFNETGDESIHLQMTSLNAVSPDGTVRLLAGQALQDEFPDLFVPTFGIAVSTVGTGFPAKSFFLPFTLIETPFGNLVANAPGYERVIWGGVIITQFPPLGGLWWDPGPQLLVWADSLSGPPAAELRELNHLVVGPGACCSPEGFCSILMDLECADQGHVWVGGPCDPNPCEESGMTEDEDGRGGLFVGPVKPNPTTGPIALTVELESPSLVQVRMYDITGRQIDVLMDEDLPAGRHTVRWEPKEDAFANGVYHLRIDAAGGQRIRKFIVWSMADSYPR